MPLPFTYDFIKNGPVPMASLPELKSVTVGQAPVTPQPVLGANCSLACWAMPFQRMGRLRAISAGSSGSGSAVLMMTVMSSGIFTSVMRLVVSVYDCDTLVSLFSVRQMVNSTSCEVNRWPLENFTPGRSLNSHVRSSRFFHDLASEGTSSILALRATSESYTWAAKASFAVLL